MDWFVYFFGVLTVLGVSQGVPAETPADNVLPSEAVTADNLSNGGSSRIVNGWVAEDGQFPYMASIRMVGPTGGVGACGGMIIRHDWILTAAHCLARRVSYVVRYGLTNLTRPDYIVESEFAKARIHPGYNQASTAVQTHDIGLLEMPYEVPYTANIQPIRIQSSERKDTEYDGEILTVSGYGRTNDLWLGGYVPEILYWILQRGITQEECRRWYTTSQTFGPQTMCVQYYVDVSHNTCTGDSGGPLTIVDHDGQLTVVGIKSFGAAVGCNTPNPSGYVRPEHYHEWIEQESGRSFDWNVSDIVST